MKTEFRYKNKLTTESCFHLHKILDSVKETRHYNASPQSPHPALTNQEAELYFQRIDILALDIIRIRLGLPKIAVEDEK